MYNEAVRELSSLAKITKFVKCLIELFTFMFQHRFLEQYHIIIGVYPDIRYKYSKLATLLYKSCEIKQIV